MRRALSCFALAVGLLTVALEAGGQTSPPTPTFKSRADLVLVPAIVRDRHGNHVPGLTAEDFILRRDRETQHIASVEEITADATTPQPLSMPESVFTNQFSSPQQAKELVIIVQDLINTPQLDLDTARKAVLKYLTKQIRPNQLVGLVIIERGQVRLLHTFTTSAVVLNAALQRVTGSAAAAVAVEQAGQALSRAEEEKVQTEAAGITALIAQAHAQMDAAIAKVNTGRMELDVKSTLESLQHIAMWVGGLPGRKVLIWITGNVPFLTNQSNAVLARVAQEDYGRAMQALADANVAVYPVDVRGLLNQDFAANSSIYLGPGSNVFNRMLTGGINGPTHLPNNHFAFNDFAAATGGKAFYNNNDIAKLLERAAADSVRYYMLSFYLGRDNLRPGWHKLEVAVKRSDVTTRARNGFFVRKPGEDALLVRQSEERIGVASPFEYTALPLAMRWMNRTAAGTSYRVAFEVSVPPTAGLAGGDGPQALDLDFLAVATAADGSAGGSSSRTFRATLKPDALQKVQTYGITYVSDLSLKPGTYAVRLVVRDNLTGRLGSITAPLRVAP